MHQYFRSDLSLDCSEPDDPPVEVSYLSIGERFLPESLPESVDSTDLDPLFALPLPNEEEPLLLQANEVQLPVMEELVDNEEMKDDSKGIIVLQFFNFILQCIATQPHPLCR